MDASRNRGYRQPRNSEREIAQLEQERREALDRERSTPKVSDKECMSCQKPFTPNLPEQTTCSQACTLRWMGIEPSSEASEKVQTSRPERDFDRRQREWERWHTPGSHH